MRMAATRPDGSIWYGRVGLGTLSHAAPEFNYTHPTVPDHVMRKIVPRVRDYSRIAILPHSAQPVATPAPQANPAPALTPPADVIAPFQLERRGSSWRRRDNPSLDLLNLFAGPHPIQPTSIPSAPERKDVTLDVTPSGPGIQMTASALTASGLGTRSQIGEWRTEDQVMVRQGDADRFTDMLSHASAIIHRGADLPEELEARIEESGVPYVRVTKASPKTLEREFLDLLRLANTPLPETGVRVFLALPYSRNLPSLTRELDAMGLDPDEAEQWLSVLEEVDALEPELAQHGVRLERPSTADIVREFSRGSNPLVFVIGHWDGNALHLPGTSGETLTLDAIAREPARPAAPDRLAIFATCCTGVVNAQKRSLSEAVVGLKMFKGVMAPEVQISASIIPDVLRRLFILRDPPMSLHKAYRFRLIGVRLQEVRFNG